MNILKTVNVALSFLLELAMLLAFGYWGFSAQKSLLMKWLLGITLPLLAALLWGLFLAPKTTYRLGIYWGGAISMFLFALAALLLYDSGKPLLAVSFAVIALINRTLLLFLKQW